MRNRLFWTCFTSLEAQNCLVDGLKFKSYKLLSKQNKNEVCDKNDILLKFSYASKHNFFLFIILCINLADNYISFCQNTIFCMTNEKEYTSIHDFNALTQFNNSNNGIKNEGNSVSIQVLTPKN